MSFPAYQNYQESGKRWLGNLPESWRVVPFWTLFQRVKRTGFPEHELLSVYRDYGVIRKRDRDDNFNKPSEDLSAYQLVEAGDLAINKMKAWQGSLGVSPHTGIVSPAYFVYRARHEQVPAYLHFLLRSDPYAVGLMTISKGIRINQWDVDPDHLAQLPVPLPSIPEQTAIAAFLDRETAKIDALVEEQRRLIELLKEKRQAVISHAVTKGLDPTVPMKDSGVKWLGQVPAHWDVKPVRYLATMAGRIGFRGYTTADLVDEGEGAVSLSPSNLRAGRVGFDKCTYLSWDKYDESPEIKLERNDVILVKTGSTYGKVAILRQADFPKATINPQLLLLKNAKCNPALLFYVLDSASVQAEISVSSTGGTIPTITQEFVGELKVPLPPLEEQEVIVEHLDALLAKLSELEREAERAVALLGEHRAALISAAVTGKIDVRGVTVRQVEAA